MRNSLIYLWLEFFPISKNETPLIPTNFIFQFFKSFLFSPPECDMLESIDQQMQQDYHQRKNAEWFNYYLNEENYKFSPLNLKADNQDMVLVKN